MKKLKSAVLTSIPAQIPALIQVLVLALITLGLTSCYYYDEVTGSGVLVTRELGYVDFEAVGIHVGGVATIVQAADFGVTVTADDNVIDLITAYPDDGGRMLRIGMERWRYYRQTSIQLEIRMPTLVGIDIGGWHDGYLWGAEVSVGSGFPNVDLLEIRNVNGELAFEQLDATEMSIYNSHGDIAGPISCTDLIIDTHGGTIELTGTANAIEIAANSGDTDLSGVVAATVVVNAESDAVVNVYVTDSISGVVDDSSVLSYDGDGAVDSSQLTLGAE